MKKLYHLYIRSVDLVKETNLYFVCNKYRYYLQYNNTQILNKTKLKYTSDIVFHSVFYYNLFKPKKQFKIRPWTVYFFIPFKKLK